MLLSSASGDKSMLDKRKLEHGAMGEFCSRITIVRGG